MKQMGEVVIKNQYCQLSTARQPARKSIVRYPSKWVANRSILQASIIET